MSSSYVNTWPDTQACMKGATHGADRLFWGHCMAATAHTSGKLGCLRVLRTLVCTASMWAAQADAVAAGTLVISSLVATTFRHARIQTHRDQSQAIQS